MRLLEEHFARLVSYEFTAGMEDVLDDIAAGRKDRVSELREFYYGSERVAGLHPLVSGLGDIDAKELATFPIGGPDTGIVLRVGKYGPYLEGPDDDGNPAAKRANVPEDLPPDELTLAKATELFANPAGEEIPLGAHPESGLPVVAKNGRFGPYVTEVLPEDAPKSAKARTGSLFKSMSLETVSLADAIKLISLPRVVGTDADGVEITAQNGRYGPYLKKGTDSRSLTTEDQIFDITLDEALAIYAQPKQRGRAAAAAPLKELGPDPVSGHPVVVKAGRFGEYVTDGEYNATLRKDDTVESITIARAAELLAERRERGPAKKTGGRKKSRRRRSRPPRRRQPRRHRQEGVGEEGLISRPALRGAPSSRPARSDRSAPGSVGAGSVGGGDGGQQRDDAEVEVVVEASRVVDQALRGAGLDRGGVRRHALVEGVVGQRRVIDVAEVGAEHGGVDGIDRIGGIDRVSGVGRVGGVGRRRGRGRSASGRASASGWASELESGWVSASAWGSGRRGPPAPSGRAGPSGRGGRPDCAVRERGRGRAPTAGRGRGCRRGRASCRRCRRERSAPGRSRARAPRRWRTPRPARPTARRHAITRSTRSTYASLWL